MLRQFARLRPAVTRMAVRPRHSSRSGEFPGIDRLVNDFISTVRVGRPAVFSTQDFFGGLDSRFRVHEHDGKLVAQMGLPDGVEPDDVKISLKGDRLEVSFRFETKRENFSSVSEFHEELKLKQVDLEKMEATIDTEEGFLRIEAPLKENVSREKKVKVNINRSDEDTKNVE